MIRSNIRSEYFKWLCDLVGEHHHSRHNSYAYLLGRLHDTEFRYSIARDHIQAAHGVNLRWRFALKRFDSDYAMDITDEWDEPCSVLEMMIALAIRCEESIMDNPQYGDRTPQWFWNMIVSLGLGSMTDERYDRDHVDNIIDTFLDREYSPDGRGGLFTIRDCEYDLRDVEITHQLYWYLDTML